jgi:hypothetical protein
VQLTGSFTYVDQRFTRERQVAFFDNSEASAISTLPTDRGQHAELMVHIYPLHS